MQFNSTQAQQIATSGNLIGLPLGSSSTTSSSSPSSTTSTSSTAPPTASQNVNDTEIGAIVVGVMGGVLLFIGVLIWWIMGSSSSRSMIARFGFPRGRYKRHSNASSTLNQGSSRMNLQPQPAKVRHLPRLSVSSLLPGSAILEPTPYILPPLPHVGHIPRLSGSSILEPTPYILPPLPQGSVPSAGGRTSYPQETPRINPPGYRSLETAIPSLSQAISAVQAQTTHPLDIDTNRTTVTTPLLVSFQMPEPPSYIASQAERWEEQVRRAGSNVTAGHRLQLTRASNHHART
jgi:hypothetical protein